jgi:hypothetical protein
MHRKPNPFFQKEKLLPAFLRAVRRQQWELNSVGMTFAFCCSGQLKPVRERGE